ncbi:hypothetical protein Tco_0783151 [Tanacetum coccineum]
MVVRCRTDVAERIVRRRNVICRILSLLLGLGGLGGCIGYGWSSLIGVGISTWEGGAGKERVVFLNTLFETKSRLLEGVSLIAEAGYRYGYRPVAYDRLETVVVVVYRFFQDILVKCGVCMCRPRKVEAEGRTKLDDLSDEDYTSMSRVKYLSMKPIILACLHGMGFSLCKSMIKWQSPTGKGHVSFRKVSEIGSKARKDNIKKMKKVCSHTGKYVKIEKIESNESVDGFFQDVPEKCDICVCQPRKIEEEGRTKLDDLSDEDYTSMSRVKYLAMNLTSSVMIILPLSLPVLSSLLVVAIVLRKTNLQCY